MTVLDIVTDALRQLGVIGETQTPSAEQGADAVTRLNDMMAAMAESDIDLGWNPKATTADSVSLPLGAVGAIKALLAVELSGKYGAEIPPTTAAMAHDGYRRLLRQGLQAAMMKTRLYVLPSGEAQRGTVRIETDQ